MYIIEKFKISKNTNQNSLDDYKVGDYLLRVFVSDSSYGDKDIENNDLLKTIDIALSNGAFAIFDKIDDKGFHFINSQNNREDCYDYETHAEINSNGYLEFDNISRPMYSFKSVSIYLKKDDALKFLNELLSNNLKFSDDIFKWIDIKYKKYVKKLKLTRFIDKEAVESIINRVEKIDEKN